MSEEKKAAPRAMSIVRMIVSLGIITGVAAVILALTYEVTSDPIADAATAQQVEAIRAVTPDFDNNPVADSLSIVPAGETEAVHIFPATKGGEPVGAAVESYSPDGFGGRITVMVGFDSDGNIVDYQVLSHSETPGLGDKSTWWFRDTVGNRSICGKNAATTSLYVVKDTEHHGEIDGITAATISSRAFLDAVRRASTAYQQYKSTQQLENK